MKKYYTISKIGKGFITHDDQEKDGLQFEIIGNVVTVEGVQNKIETWAQRNVLTSVTEDVLLAEKAKIVTVTLNDINDKLDLILSKLK